MNKIASVEQKEKYDSTDYTKIASAGIQHLPEKDENTQRMNECAL